MSAVTSNSSDRELEALRRAQRAHEPSMEEILASIRTIIADERDPAKADLPKAGPHRPAAPAPGPQIVYSKDAPVVEPLAQEPPQLPENDHSPEAGRPKVDSKSTRAEEFGTGGRFGLDRGRAFAFGRDR